MGTMGATAMSGSDYKGGAFVAFDKHVCVCICCYVWRSRSRNPACLGEAQPFLQARQHRGQITGEEGRRVQPQAGEDLAAQDPLRVGLQRPCTPLAEDEPVHLLLIHLHGQVLLHAVPGVHAALVVQVIGGTLLVAISTTSSGGPSR